MATGLVYSCMLMNSGSATFVTNAIATFSHTLTLQYGFSSFMHRNKIFKVLVKVWENSSSDHVSPG